VTAVSVPDYESLMLPVLHAVADGQPRPAAQVREVLAASLHLSEDDLTLRLPSGSPIFNSRVHWAATYMAQAGLIRRPRRGVLQITDRGRRGGGHRRGGAADDVGVPGRPAGDVGDGVGAGVQPGPGGDQGRVKVVNAGSDLYSSLVIMLR
jgi:hypothetical protein